jgi:hypothetical protein
MKESSISGHGGAPWLRSGTAPPRGWQLRWPRYLNLSSQEFGLLRQLGGGVFLLGVSFSMGTVAAEAMILARLGAAYLPLAFIVQQAATLACAAAYLRWGRTARADRPFGALAVVAAVVSVITGLAVELTIGAASILLFGIVHAATTFSLVHFHNVRGSLLDAQVTKLLHPRLLSLFMVGKLIGGMVSLISCRVTPALWGPLYGVSALLAGLALAWPYRPARGRESGPEPGKRPSGASGQWAAGAVPDAPGGRGGAFGTVPDAPGGRGGAIGAVPDAPGGRGGAFGAVRVRSVPWRALITHPLSRWALTATALIVIVERCLELVAGAYLCRINDVQGLASLLAVFTTAAALVAAVVQAFISGPLAGRFGPARMTCMFPVVVLASVAFAHASHGLAGALLLRFGFTYLPACTVDPTYGLLEGGLPPRLALTIRVMKAGVIRPAGTLAVALAGSAGVLGDPLLVAVVVAVGLALFALPVPALYARTWLELLKNRGTSRADLGTFRPPEIESALHDEIVAGLSLGDPESAEAALDLLEAAGSTRAIAAAEQGLARCPDETLRARIVEVLGRLGWTPPADLVQRLAGQPDAVRAEVFLVRAGRVPALEAAAVAELDSGADGPARVAAAGYLLGADRGRADLAPVVVSALSSGSAATVSLALRAIHRARARVDAAAVTRASRHADERVRRASVGALQAEGCTDRLADLALHDTHAAVRATALEALAQEDAARGRDLAARLLADPSDRVHRAARALIASGGEDGLSLVRRHAADWGTWWPLRERAIALLAELERGSDTLGELARAEVQHAKTLHEVLCQLPESSPSIGVRFTRALMEDEVIVSFYLSVRCLTAHLGETFFDTVMTGLRHSSWRVRAQALESLASRLLDGLPRGMAELARDTAYLARLSIGTNPAGFPLERTVPGTVTRVDGSRWVGQQAWLALTPTAAPGAPGGRGGAFGAARRGDAVAPLPAGAIAHLRALLSGPDAHLAAAIAWGLRDLEGVAPEVPAERRSRATILEETLAWLADPMYPEGMPTLATIAFLKGTEFFVGFGAEELHLIAQATRLETFEQGDELFQQGDTADELYILVRGTVEVVQQAPSGTRSLAVLGPKETVGELGLFDGLPRSATVLALDRVEALSISRSDLATVLAQSPLVSLAFLKVLALRVRQTAASVDSGPAAPPAGEPDAARR